MKLHDSITPRLRRFVERQHVFFVATAPDQGHLNLSPRGGPGTFRVIDEHTFAWLDVTGSGAETTAHLRDNERIVVMFCAFEGKPNIVRFHGTGRVVTKHDAEFAALAEGFTRSVAERSVIVVDVTRVSDSCGFGVPLMDYAGERDLLSTYFERKGGEKFAATYRRRHNQTSIDGLAGYDFD